MHTLQVSVMNFYNSRHSLPRPALINRVPLRPMQAWECACSYARTAYEPQLLPGMQCVKQRAPQAGSQ